MPGLGPSAGTLGNVVLPLQAGPLHLMPRLGLLSLWLLGAPALIEHMRQVRCVYLSELFIVTQSSCQVPVFACGQEMTEIEIVRVSLCQKTMQEGFLISMLTNEISTCSCLSKG